MGHGLMKALPNILTASRILVIPPLVVAFYLPFPEGNCIAFVLYVLAAVTDFFDGYLARSMHTTSKLGQFLDPIADKLIVVSTILMLVAFGRIEGLHIVAALIILCREILVSGLREFLATLTIQVPVTQLAKWKTALQLVALGGLILGEAAPVWLPAELVGLSCLWIAAALTAYTGYGYIRAGMKHIW